LPCPGEELRCDPWPHCSAETADRSYQGTMLAKYEHFPRPQTWWGLFHCTEGASSAIICSLKCRSTYSSGR
jgi:hypothetical protein